MSTTGLNEEESLPDGAQHGDDIYKILVYVAIFVALFTVVMFVYSCNRIMRISEDEKAFSIGTDITKETSSSSSSESDTDSNTDYMTMDSMPQSEDSMLYHAVFRTGAVTKDAKQNYLKRKESKRKVSKQTDSKQTDSKQKDSARTAGAGKLDINSVHFAKLKEVLSTLGEEEDEDPEILKSEQVCRIPEVAIIPEVTISQARATAETYSQEKVIFEQLPKSSLVSSHTKSRPEEVKIKIMQIEKGGSPVQSSTSTQSKPPQGQSSAKRVHFVEEEISPDTNVDSKKPDDSAKKKAGSTPGEGSGKKKLKGKSKPEKHIKQAEIKEEEDTIHEEIVHSVAKPKRALKRASLQTLVTQPEEIYEETWPPRHCQHMSEISDKVNRIEGLVHQKAKKDSPQIIAPTSKNPTTSAQPETQKSKPQSSVSKNPDTVAQNIERYKESVASSKKKKRKIKKKN